jgi:hypothetical protein
MNRRALLRGSSLSMVAAVMLALSGCAKNEPEAPAAPVEQAAPAAPAPEPTAAPAPAPATPEREPTAEEVPVQQDFQAEAEQQINAKNLKTELDDLQKQIDAPTK